MKRLLAILCVLALVLSLLPLAVFAEVPTTEFVVLSTTDMHGKCWDTNVLTDGADKNNMLRLKTAVDGIRAQYSNVLLMDNGDLYQGTQVSSAQLNKFSAGESTDPLAMALCLAEIGYDYAGLGNHEFNYPWATMQAARAYLQEKGVGTICANLYYEEGGANVFTPYAIKELTVGGKTLKIGILDLEAPDCPRWDVPDNYPGIIFHHPDNPSCSMAWEVDHYLPLMKADGCEFIIVMYHGGAGSDSGELVFGTNTESQAARMIKETSGVDMVIAGHDHSTGYSNTYLKNKDGKDVLIVNGGGSQLTKTVFSFRYDSDDNTFAYEITSSENLSIGNYAVDTDLQAKLQPYADLAIAYVGQEAGRCIGTWDTKSNFYLEQTTSMDLIQAAQMYEGSKYMAAKYDTQEKIDALYAATGLDHLDVDMSSTSVVVNGSYKVAAGSMTMKDIYRLYRYDNTLYLLPLTGAQIKAVLEKNASDHLKATVKNGSVSYSTIGEDFTNPVFGGLNFYYDMSKDAGNRAVISGFSNGRAFDLEKTYVVGVNNYHLGNVGCGFGAYSTSDAIWSQTDDLGGGTVQDLILLYLQEITASEAGGVDPASFNWTWKLDYTGSLDAPAKLEGDNVAKKITEIADGTQLYIYYDADGSILSTEPSGNRIGGVQATASGDYIAFTGTGALYTVELQESTERTEFALKLGDTYLTSGDAGNSLRYDTTLTDMGKWYLTAAYGGFHIMNVGANYNGNHNQALEYYSGFTTYGVKDTAAYLFNLYAPVEVGTLASGVEDGGRYVIYYDAEEKFVSTGFTPVENTMAGGKLILPVTGDTLVLNASINGDGNIAFITDDGKYLTSALMGNGISLEDTEQSDDLSRWKLVAVDGGFHVMSVGASYNGNHNQALEYYGGRFTTYGVKDTGIYLYNFYKLPAKEAEGKLKSVYASYADKGHTNDPLTDETFVATGDEIKISVLTTTDMHGRVYDWNSYTDSPLASNYLQAAEIITAQRALADDTIVVDDGDILQGSAVSSYSNTQEAAYHTPLGTALRYIDYDVVTLGNHEFNYSPQIQWNLYNYLMSENEALPGKEVDVVCANIIENETQESVFAPYKLFPYQFPDGKTFTIAVLAFENMNNANWDVASHYEGCNFAHAGNENMSYVYEYETFWKEELADKADFVIVMAHTGEGGSGSYGQENQGAWLVANTEGIDLLITGHSHGARSTTVDNKNGKAIPVINAGGSNVGKLEITLTKGEDGITVTCGAPTNIALSTASAPNTRNGDTAEYQSPTSAEYNELKALIKPAFEKADTFVNTTIGTVSGEWDNISSYYTTQSDSYDLVHKAQIWAVTTACKLNPETDHIVSLTTPVASSSFKIANLFTEGAASASISLKNCYSLYKYDNNTLFLIKMTGAQLKSWMQRTVQSLRVRNGSVSGGGFGTDQFYGVNYEGYMGNEAGKQVVNIKWPDGKPVEDTDEIYVALSSYRLSATEGSDSYGWYAATGITSSSEEVLWDATISDEFNTVGGSVPLIIGEYIKSLTAEGKDVTPGSETHWSISAEDYPEIALDFIELTDIHGSIGSTTDSTAGRMAVLIEQTRQLNPTGTFLLGGGDFYQGSVCSNLFHGKPVQDWMDYVGFDVETVGNHEFDWQLQTIIDETMAGSTAAMISCNILYQEADGTHEKDEPVFPHGSVIVEKNGVKVLYVGSLSECSSAIAVDTMKNIYIANPVEYTRKEIAKYAPTDYDIIVLINHGDGGNLTNLAKLADEGYPVKLVFGGHSHSTVATDYTTPGGHRVPYFVASSNNNGLIHVSATYYPKSGELAIGTVSKNESFISLGKNNPAEDDPLYDYFTGAWNIIKGWEADPNYQAMVNEIIGYSSVDLPRRTTQMNDFSCECIGWLAVKGLNDLNPDREPTKGVFALTNSGGLRCNWNVWTDDLYNKDGSIPYALVYAYNPFENYVYGLDVSYETFMKVVNYMADNNQLGVCFSGINVIYDSTLPKGERVLYVASEDGYVFVPGDTITLASQSFLIPGGDNYTMFTNVTDESGKTLAELMMGTETEPAYTPGTIRDAIAEWLRYYNAEKLAVYDQTGPFSSEGWKDLNDVMDPTVHYFDAAAISNAGSFLNEYADYLSEETASGLEEALKATADADGYVATMNAVSALNAKLTPAQKEALTALAAEVTEKVGTGVDTAIDAALSDANKIITNASGANRLNVGKVLNALMTAYKNYLDSLTVTIQLFETTDIHGYLMDTSSGDESTFQYRMAYLADLFNNARASENNDAVLLLDGGDVYQGTPVSNLLYGEALRAAMDYMDYDAFVLGNHDFDWGVDTYAADAERTVPAYDIGGFTGDPDTPVLAYDLYYAGTTNHVDFASEYVIVEKAGKRIALIGYIPNYRGDIMAARIDPYDIDADMTKLAARVHEINELEKPDVTIVMAHESPRSIAAAMDPNEVDLVTGGHSHSGTYGVADNGVTYIQGGSQAQGYAYTTIEIDSEGNVTVSNPGYTSITGNKRALYDTEENAEHLDPTVMAISHAAWAAVGDEMSEVLGYIDTPIAKNGGGYAGNWVTGLMLRGTAEWNTVAAFYNSGGIRTSFNIPAGETTRDITVGDIYTIAPFGNMLYVYEITGAEFAQQIINGFKNGNYGDQMSGLTYTYYTVGSGRNTEYHIVSITLDDGTEVDVNDTETLYRVCTSEYSGTLAGGIFENKTPLVQGAECPIDNVTMIALLREEGLANDGYISVDTRARGKRIDICESFTDLKTDKWYHDGVHYTLEQGLMSGIGNRKFDPNGQLTRAMVVSILYRMEGSPEVEFEALFTDVKDGKWFADAVVWGAKNNIVAGTGDGKFNPNGAVTREQIASFLYRYAEFKGKLEEPEGDLSAFPDADKVSSWAAKAMLWANVNGLILGRADGDTTLLAPKGTATRAEFASIVQRALSEGGPLYEAPAGPGPRPS